MKIGCPILKLKPHGTAKVKDKHGAVDKLLDEMYEERKTSSPTFDPTRSKYNQYNYPAGCHSGADAIEWIQQQYNNNWNESHTDAPRKDATFGFTGIIKPPHEEMNAMTRQEQDRFLGCALQAYAEVCNNHNIKIDGYAVHRDEKGPHIHVIAHSKTFTTFDFHSLKFRGDLNRELPRIMRDKYGFKDVENCVRDRSKPKKPSGLDVSTYAKRKVKTQTDKLQAENDKLREKIEQDRAEQQRLQDDIAVQQAKLKLVVRSIKNKVEQQEKKDADFQMREDALQAQEQALRDEIDIFEGRKQKRSNDRIQQAKQRIQNIQQYNNNDKSYFK